MKEYKIGEKFEIEGVEFQNMRTYTTSIIKP